ncbi:MAG: hypothetical protein AAGF10_03775, partial [Verrucomicrobiota bacterium]
APAIERVPEEEAAKIVEAHEKNRLNDEAEETASSGTEAEPAAQQAPAEKPTLNNEDVQVRQLFADLRWLVREGYVTEFADGRLFANPEMEPPAPKTEAPAAPAAEPVVEETAAQPTAEAAAATAEPETPEQVKSEAAAEPAASEQEVPETSEPEPETKPAPVPLDKGPAPGPLPQKAQASN